MGLYDGYLILSDIDGTLTVNGTLSEENLRAIRRFQREGGRFALATGRKTDYTDRFPFRSNAPLITFNGTMITSPEGEELYALPLHNDYQDVLTEIAEHFPHVKAIYRYERENCIEWRRDTDGTCLTKLLSDETCFKLVFVSDSEEAALRLKEEMIARWGERYEFDRSWPVGLELHAKGSGKDACLHRIRSLLPEIHTIIAVGDYENDIPMLRAADIGCAVANALPAVREAADRIIVPNTEHAVAYIIDTLISSLS